uniref:Integrase zinc-binding domain-containing protein n=1 Tax=Amphimedon queenslandica TaxID=400682 RepID=A0A1X7V7W4_AMPQE
PYQQRQNDLCLRGCVLRCSRVVVPLVWREKAIEMLHEGHIGMSRMKSKAHSYLWRPKMNADIER